MAGSAEDRARARTCLAQTAWYEAGQDRAGQQAVVQVVLNRVRHPAYPKTICGVVFQGSERRTGCQFTFTCDGSLARVPSAAAWKDALAVADAGTRRVRRHRGRHRHALSHRLGGALLERARSTRSRGSTPICSSAGAVAGASRAPFTGRYAGGEQARPGPGEVLMPEAARQLAVKGTLMPSDAIITLDRGPAVTCAG
jgi:hypothetical protein